MGELAVGLGDLLLDPAPPVPEPAPPVLERLQQRWSTSRGLS